MSIQMSMQIRWSIDLNTSDIPQHAFQEAIEKIAAKTYIFKLNNGAFAKIGEFYLQERFFDLWACRDSSADVRFAVVETFRSASQEEDV